MPSSPVRSTSFHGRLDGVTFARELAPELPVVRADTELLRRVIVNLIDNAAEAMEGATAPPHHSCPRASMPRAKPSKSKSPTPATAFLLRTRTNSSCRIFPPKSAAPVSAWPSPDRIVAEHHGTLRVEDNVPAGARFIIRFPAAEAVRHAMRSSQLLSPAR